MMASTLASASRRIQTCSNAASAPITIFTSIRSVAESLHDVAPHLVTHVLEDDALRGRGGTVHFDPSALRPATKLALRHAEILVAEPSVVARLLAHDASALPSLRWCFSTYAGVDPLFRAGLTLPLPWRLTRFAGCFGPPIAEWCLARVVGHERGFAASAADQLHGEWAGSKEAILEYRYLSSLTLSVLGCGEIGRCIARAAKAFGMKTVGYGKTSRRKDQPVEWIDEYTTDLSVALQNADYIASVLPSTPQTRGLLNGDAFRAGSEGKGGKRPVFLNVGRGDVIDEASLLHALDERWISAAILDVFEVEPLPKESELWRRSDVTISPHVSGLTQAKDVPKVFLENYARFIEGRALKYEVDWNKGY